jgi:hypothetical protein
LRTARNLCWGVSKLNQYIPIHNGGFIRLLSSDTWHTWLDDVLKMTAMRNSLAQTHNKALQWLCIANNLQGCTHLDWRIIAIHELHLCR